MEADAEAFSSAMAKAAATAQSNPEGTGSKAKAKKLPTGKKAKWDQAVLAMRSPAPPEEEPEKIVEAMGGPEEGFSIIE